jgi:hypothetical protein
LDQKTLSSVWHEITGDSSIVDVRPILSAEEACKYVAKYAAKGTDAGTYHNPVALREYIAAIKGRRLIASFGTWRGLKFDTAVRSECRWISLGSLSKIMSFAAAGNQDAIAILSLLTKRQKLVEKVCHPFSTA